MKNNRQSLNHIFAFFLVHVGIYAWFFPVAKSKNDKKKQKYRPLEKDKIFVHSVMPKAPKGISRRVVNEIEKEAK